MNFLTNNLLLNNYLTKTLLILLLMTYTFAVFAQVQFIGSVNDRGCAIEQVNKVVYKDKIKEELEADLVSDPLKREQFSPYSTNERKNLTFYLTAPSVQ